MQSTFALWNTWYVHPVIQPKYQALSCMDLQENDHLLIPAPVNDILADVMTLFTIASGQRR